MIDPHSDTTRRMLGYIHNEDRNRIVYVSSGINTEYPSNEKYTCVLNIFEHDGSEYMKNVLASELTEAIGELLSEVGNNALTINMIAHLRPAIAVTLDSPEPSMQTLRRFFGQNCEDLVRLGQQSSNPQYRDWFTYDFSLPEHALTKKAIRTKLSYFLGDETLYRMLNGKSTINIEKCMNEGKVVLISLPRGAGRFCTSVMSRLLIAHIHAIAMRRETIQPKYRVPTFLYLDEMQTMVTQSLASSLQECRKMNLFLVLATQSLKQIPNAEMRKTISVNTGIQMIGQTDAEDRDFFRKEHSLQPDMLDRLMPLEFVVKRKGGQYKPFRVKVPILSRLHFMSEKKRSELLEYMVLHSGYYKPVSALPPPPPSASGSQKQTPPKTDRRTTKDDPFDDDDYTPPFK